MVPMDPVQDEDYNGDYNIKKLAYIGISAMNYLQARRMLHSISHDINCDDPIETIFNADKLAAAIQYNNMIGGGLKIAHPSSDYTEEETAYYLATL